MNNLIQGILFVALTLSLAYSPKETKETKKPSNDIMSIYLPGDIAHIADLTVTFEVADTSYTFKTIKELYEYIEELTSYASSIHGYKEDLNFLINLGYVYANTVYNKDEQYTELIYNGPNWTVDSSKDTSYVISTFNTIEKLYNPATCTYSYESYTK